MHCSKNIKNAPTISLILYPKLSNGPIPSMSVIQAIQVKDPMLNVDPPVIPPVDHDVDTKQ